MGVDPLSPKPICFVHIDGELQTRIIGAWVQLTRTATVAAFGASAGGMDTL